MSKGGKGGHGPSGNVKGGTYNGGAPIRGGSSTGGTKK